MIAGDFGLRLALLVPVLWLAMLVYAGLKENDAAGTLRTANQKTLKTLAWLAAIAVAMFAIEWAFID